VCGEAPQYETKAATYSMQVQLSAAWAQDQPECRGFWRGIFAAAGRRA
jgi:hypothetical protein